MYGGSPETSEKRMPVVLEGVEGVGLRKTLSPKA